MKASFIGRTFLPLEGSPISECLFEVTFISVPFLLVYEKVFVNFSSLLIFGTRYQVVFVAVRLYSLSPAFSGSSLVIFLSQLVVVRADV